jgi:hypothetical protein
LLIVFLDYFVQEPQMEISKIKTSLERGVKESLLNIFVLDKGLETNMTKQKTFFSMKKKIFRVSCFIYLFHQNEIGYYFINIIL